MIDLRDEHVWVVWGSCRMDRRHCHESRSHPRSPGVVCTPEGCRCRIHVRSPSERRLCRRRTFCCRICVDFGVDLLAKALTDGRRFRLQLREQAEERTKVIHALPLVLFFPLPFFDLLHALLKALDFRLRRRNLRGSFARLCGRRCGRRWQWERSGHVSSGWRREALAR